jgi:hypothetical protein
VEGGGWRVEGGRGGGGSGAMTCKPVVFSGNTAVDKAMTPFRTHV